LLWLLLLLLPVCYFIQEMVVRLGVVTGKGHAAMIYERFGKWWGRFSPFDLLLVNFLTLVTEFAAIALATQQMGVAPYWSGPLAAIRLVVHVISGGYRRWERVTCVLCLIDTVRVVMAFTSHTSAAAIARNVFVPSVPAGGITTSLVFLVIAIVGTTIAPWQLFSNTDCQKGDRELSGCSVSREG
jgi:Mn2+/Fe2+ NRAMP family transporter